MLDNKTIRPLLENKIVWDCLVKLIESKEREILDRLIKYQPPEELIRMNGQIQVLDWLKQYRERTKEI